MCGLVDVSTFFGPYFHFPGPVSKLSLVSSRNNPREEAGQNSITDDKAGSGGDRGGDTPNAKPWELPKRLGNPTFRLPGRVPDPRSDPVCSCVCVALLIWLQEGRGVMLAGPRGP